MQTDSDVDEALAGADDRTATRILALIVEDQNMEVEGLREQDAAAAVRSALQDDPDLQFYYDSGVRVSDRDLAVNAITYLLSTDLVSQALVVEAIRAAKVTSREPLSIGILGLVLAVMKTEIKISKEPEKGWKFSLHKRPVKDSSLGKLVSALLAKLDS